MISVIIPVYKNTNSFLKLLKYNLKYLQKSEIIIVNDNPQENLQSAVEKIAPNAIIINNPQNYGFAKSMNLGVKKAQGDYLLFLNSDVKLLHNNLASSLKEFQNPKLFALTFAQIEKNGHITGANQGRFYKGLFHHQERKSDTVSENLWPEGGSSLVRKQYFAQLGGFDEIYSPFYWEDVDLGFRAQKKGWLTLFYPLIKVEHHHQTTISKYYSKTEIRTISYRNQLLFVWKNIPLFQQLQHWLYLPILLLQNRSNQEFKQGLRQALTVWLRQK